MLQIDMFCMNYILNSCVMCFKGKVMHLLNSQLYHFAGSTNSNPQVDSYSNEGQGKKVTCKCFSGGAT